MSNLAESEIKRDSLREDLQNLALSLRSGSTKGRHVTGVFDLPMLEKYIKTLILELIGEDEDKKNVMALYSFAGYKHGYNKAKKELRKKVEAL